MKGFLRFFESGREKEVLTIVESFQTSNPNYYELIHKIYSGEQLENRNNITLTKQETITLNSAKTKIKKLLSKNNMSNNKIQAKGFLQYFDESREEEVLKIVEELKVINPNYYEIIHKLYSGERLEQKNNITLSKQEKNVLNSAKVKIKKILSNEIKLSNQLKGFLQYFDEGQEEEVLKIVEELKVINPNYYEIIHKLYSGERLEQKNNITLSKQEKNVLNSAKVKIKKILSNEIKLSNQLKGFLQYFDEGQEEEVLKIVEELKVINPNYYEIIHKLYSGERLGQKNNITLSKKERKVFDNTKLKIRKILSNEMKLSNQLKGFLQYFEQGKEEEVLAIIEEFKVINPNYYEIIHKLYIGERLEQKNNITLSKQEKNVLNSAKVKIKKILSNEMKLSNQLKGFLQYFDEGQEEEVLKIVEELKVINPNYYEIIHKLYSGERLEQKNNIILNKQERKILNSAKVKIKKILSNEIKLSNQLKGFLQYFDEGQEEEVLKIVEELKVINPNYYEIIHKLYSGERLEQKNNIILNKQERKILNSAKVKIKKILSNEMKLSNQLKGFLQYFDEGREEDILKIVEEFRVIHPSYYDIIHKLYSGEKLEQKNNTTLNKQEKIVLNNAKAKIRYLLKNNAKIKINSIENIILFLPKMIQENSLFYNIKAIKKEIFKEISADDIVDYYILHLNKFYESDIIEIIKIIATFKPEKVEMLMGSSYIKEKIQFLTLKEQIYFYLKLKSYSITTLTDKKIAEILSVEKSFLEQYRIMTIDEETNQLNQIIKNKNR